MTDAASMATNLAEVIPTAVSFLNVVVSVLAIGLFVWATMKFVSHSKGRDGTRLSTPVYGLLSATMLWNLGMSATAFLETIYGEGTSTSNLLAYSASDSLPDETQEFLKVIIMAIRLYGYYAFAKGWWKVRNIGVGTAASEGAFGSASLHIAGGVGCINLVETVNLASNTFGFGDVL